jgi:hypothetical protein
MKEIKTIVKERVAKPVEYEEKEVEKIIYEADDGKQFNNKKDCEKYSNILERETFLNTLKIIDVDDYGTMPENLLIVYFAESEHFAKFIKYRYSGCEVHDAQFLVFPQYYGFGFVGGGDYRDSVFVYDEVQIKEWFNSMDNIRKELYENNTGI